MYTITYAQNDQTIFVLSDLFNFFFYKNPLISIKILSIGLNVLFRFCLSLFETFFLILFLLRWTAPPSFLFLFQQRPQNAFFSCHFSFDKNKSQRTRSDEQQGWGTVVIPFLVKHQTLSTTSRRVD